MQADFRFLSGAGEMAASMRTFGWRTTPIGPPDGWPRSLKTLVGVMLRAKQAMFIAWGDERTMLYNDAYAELLGAKHPCLGQPFERVWAEIWADIKPLVDQVFAGEPVHMDDIQLFIERGAGLEEAHFAFSYTPVIEDEEVVGLFCPTRETTEQVMVERSIVEARKAAEDANLAKSTFIANMSHELRTPLSAIIGYSEMMLEDVADGVDPASFSDDIRKVEGNARHLLGLINDVLDLSKVESGKMEVFAEPFDVAEVVRDVSGAVAALVSRKNNRLGIEVEPGLGEMNTDVVKVRQILLNLLSNAAKFTDGGTILLKASRRDELGMIEFEVADTGIGMTDDQLAKLFQRFQQADVSTTRRFGGTGLGLSLAKAFATMLGGAISVESRSGEGSTFTVRLPADLPAPETSPAEATGGMAAPQEQGGAERTILVIDDDPDQRDLMSRFLSREGFLARLAADGPSGLALARAIRPRAILLDVMMPNMDGWSVLKALKDDPDLAAIPVVMVTFTSERALASSLGATDYIAKPVHWDRFREVMDRFREGTGDILVVDDDADARSRLRKALERDEWTVAEAGNGQEALAAVAQALPRAILLDLNMPVMDGFSFLHALRDWPECQNIPVIILSARDLSDADRAQLQSAARVISKGSASLKDVAANVRALAGDPAP
ncbi:MAG: response regulator [Parafilimonas terrae]|nr:response regulator [Parafilimonas terrae]